MNRNHFSHFRIDILSFLKIQFKTKLKLILSINILKGNLQICSRTNSETGNIFIFKKSKERKNAKNIKRLWD